MDVTDKLRFEVNVNGWINKSDPQAPQAFEFDPIVLPAVSEFVTGNPNNNAAILSTLPLAPQKARAADWTPGLPKGDERMGQIALRGTYELSDDILLTSITAYTAYKRRNQVDTDGYAVAAFDQDAVDGDITSFTQELRISNDAGEPLRWMIGGNYEHSKVDEYANSFYPDASTIDFFIALFPAGAGWIGNSYFSNQKMNNYAAFGNLEYDIDPDLTVKLGGRYTHTKRAVDQCTNDQGDGKWAAIVDGLNGYAARGIPLLAPGACTTAEPNPTPGPDFGNPIPITGFQGVLKEHNFSWRIGLDYQPSPTTLIYANLSQGYKAGGFPNVVATLVEQMSPVTQERLLAAEVGVKKRLLNNRASITAAAYNYDYSDKQIRSGIFIAPFGVLDKLTNIPKSSIRGAELELAVRPVPGLDLTASGTFTDARIDRFIGIAGNGNAVHFGGTDIPYNSKWAATGIAEYEWDVSDSLKASLGATLSYRSKSAGALGSAGDTTLNAYTILDLRAGIGALDDKWRVQMWGKNVTNKYYWLNTVHAFDNNVRYAARPVTYGVSVSFEY